MRGLKRPWPALKKVIAIRIKPSRSVFIAVGSNLKNREANLKEAWNQLARTVCVKTVKASPVYETDPVGGPTQGKYLNAVWEIKTSFLPGELLNELLRLEKRMGRRRTVPNAPRIIDLDILFYGNEVIQRRRLKIPHPRLHEREFVLKPLADIAPDFTHPVLKKTVRVLLKDL